MIRTSRIGAVLAVVALAACGSDTVTNPETTASPTPQPTSLPTPAATPTPAALANVSGSWDSEARRWHFRLEQTGSVITGQLLGYRDVYYGNPEHPDLAITGTVSSTGAVSFGCNAFAVHFDGQVASTSQMTGTTYDCGITCRNYGEVMVKTAD
jgi:hypothetical protein